MPGGMMKHRPAMGLPPNEYPVDPWRLIQLGFHRTRAATSETLFALSNGYLGVRGVFEEGEPVYERGTFINGFHDTWPIIHGEEAYGLTSTGQTIVSVPDATAMTMFVEDEPMLMSQGYLLSHERSLDFRTGALTREFEWESRSGIRLHMRSQRFVSLAHRHLAMFRFEVNVIAGHGRLTMRSGLSNPQLGSSHAGRDPRRNVVRATAVEPTEWAATNDDLFLRVRTHNSRLAAACGARHAVGPNLVHRLSSSSAPEEVALSYEFDVEPGSAIRLEKSVAYQTSEAAAGPELAGHVARALAIAAENGFDRLLAAQREHLDEFWERADVRVEGDRAIQQAVRWNLFQLAQACLRAEGHGVPAKGLTGSGYGGHYFWDTEMYLEPFLNYTFPEITRDLLRFRYRMLDAARRNARVVGERGALFPWRTINGEEASAYFLAGTAQYHIDADIALALRKYVDASGDDEALREFGAEILVETARLWTSLGFHSAASDAFHIHSVTGPDEYTTVVDDNTYTNLMARENLWHAAKVIEALGDRDPTWYEEFTRRLQLAPEEITAWRRAADGMVIPYDPDRGIHPQDAHFLEKEVWNFSATPPENFPLLLHYHPLVIYRFQVLKQADVVLAMLLLPEHFTPAQRRSNFEYYEPLTTGDSSLSHAVQSTIAAELGLEDLALEHFNHTLFMDLSNWAGNSNDGVHIASSAGVWLALVHGFAGLRDFGGHLRFDPRLPGAWTEIAFALRVRGQRLAVRVGRTSIGFRWAGDGELRVQLQGREVVLLPGRDTRLEYRD